MDIDYDEIVSIEEFETVETYDIELEKEPRNFFANDLLVHNSHCAAYSMISYWCMWAKVYHPIEFLSASLSFSAKDIEEKQKFINDIYSRNIDIVPPKIGVSDSYKWVVNNDKIYIPFIEIKGIGDKKATQFSKIKFKKPRGFGVRREVVTNNDDKLLYKIGARRHEELWNDDINEFFEFGLKEPDKYHNLKKIVGNEFFTCDLDDIVIGKISPECKKPVIMKDGKYNVVVKSDVWNELKKYKLSKRNFSDNGVIEYAFGNKNKTRWNEEMARWEVTGSAEYFIDIFSNMKG